MEAYIIIGFLFAFPLFIGMLFRVNTTHLFVTILAAELLERYFRYEVELVLRPFIGNETVLGYTALAMLIIPLVLTGVFLHGSLSRSGIVLHFIPLILCGIVFAAFAGPVLPAAIQGALSENVLGELLLDNSQFIVGVTVLLQLFALWFLTKKHKKDSKK